MNRLSLIALLVVLPSCATQFATTVTSSRTLTPKQADCTFAVVTSRDRPSEELAILDIKPIGFGPTIRTAADFKELVQNKVCELGGDAVYAEINGLGVYVRGTVLRWKE